MDDQVKKKKIIVNSIRSNKENAEFLSNITIWVDQMERLGIGRSTNYLKLASKIHDFVLRINLFDPTSTYSPSSNAN